MSEEKAPSTSTTPEGKPAEPRVIEVRYRRAPRFGRFIGTGVVLGLLLALVLTFVGTSGSSSVLLPLAVGLSLVGAMVGGGLAVVADWRSG